MRVRLPLNGFRFFKGNWIFHVALFIGSHYAVQLNYFKDGKDVFKLRFVLENLTFG